ncbi:hypothetical protein TNCV_4122301 [Trichonephila clavipes]|nr:hypothetical protein TNCV_4122301 [Trichonephila clavipes]
MICFTPIPNRPTTLLKQVKKKNDRPRLGTSSALRMRHSILQSKKWWIAEKAVDFGLDQTVALGMLRGKREAREQ